MKRDRITALQFIRIPFNFENFENAMNFGKKSDSLSKKDKQINFVSNQKSKATF